MRLHGNVALVTGAASGIGYAVSTLFAEQGAARALFRCTVEARIPAPLSVFARLALLLLFLRRHVCGETPVFALDIARKLQAEALAPSASRNRS